MVPTTAHLDRPRRLWDLLDLGQHWTPGERLRLFQAVALQVQSLHDSGRLHRAIGVDSIEIDEQLRPILAPAPAEVSLGIGGDSDSSPPEMAIVSRCALSADIASAAVELAAAGCTIDPRRIDLYQLGMLLCQVLTGESALGYLYSPMTAARVPLAIRLIIDRLLGHVAGERMTDVAELLAALETALADMPPSRPASSIETPAPTGALTPPPAAQARPESSAVESARTGDVPFEALGAYRIVARLGHGGMGDVYKAYEPALDRFVAIKVLPADLARHPDFVRRFRAEAAAVARLVHPHIVQIHAIGEDAGRHYFVMQFVEGETLAQLLKRERSLDIEQSLTIVEQCLAGLSAAHDEGMVHRDVKPGNVLLDRKADRALLADFGLVKSIGRQTDATATGVIMGTVDYIAPEQARGLPVDGRSDLYSLGVMLYEMLSGVLPFTAESATAMVFQHAYEPPRPLRDAAPRIPAALEQIVSRLLRKDPNQRQISAQAVLDDLAAFRAGRPIAAPSAEDAAASGRRTTTLVTAPPREPDAELPPALRLLGTGGIWRRVGDRVASLFHRHAPEVLQQLQSTSQQVDSAVAEHQRRADRLVRLRDEALAIESDLAAQLAANQEAGIAAAARGQTLSAGSDEATAALAEAHSCEANAAALAEQLRQQRVELVEIDSRLAQARARLAQLRGQRDLLRARLKVAEARTGRRPLRPAARWALLATAAAVVAMIVYIGGRLRTANSTGSGEGLRGATTQGTTSPNEPERLNGPMSVKLNIPARVLAASPIRRRNGLKYRFAAGHDDGNVYEYQLAWQDHMSRGQGFVGHMQRVQAMSYSPDGSRLATACDDHTVRIWMVHERREIRQFKGHSDKVQFVSFSPDGTKLLSISLDATAQIWDVQNEARLATIRDHRTGPAIWLPDSKRIIFPVSRSPNRSSVSGLSLYDSDTGNETDIAYLPEQRTLQLAISQDGRSLIWVAEQSIHVLETQGWTVKRSLNVDVQVAAVSPEGGRVLCATFNPDKNPNRETSFRLVDLRSGEVVHEFSAKIQLESAFGPPLVISEDGLRAFGAGINGLIQAWKLPPPPQPAGQLQVIDAKGPVSCVAFLPDGFRVAWGEDIRLAVADLQDASRHFGGRTEEEVLAIGVSSNGERIAYGIGQPRARFGFVGLCEIDRDGIGQEVRRFEKGDERYTAVAMTDRGWRIVSATDGGAVRVWNARDETMLDEFRVPAAVNGLAVSPDETSVLLGLDDPDARLWDLRSKTELKRFAGHTAAVTSVSLSSDGTRAATGSADRTVRVWNVLTGESLATLDGHSGRVNSVAISADGRRVLSGSDDGIVRLWSVEDARCVNEFVGHSRRVRGVAISPDGSRGLSGGDDSTVRVWDLDAPPEIESDGATKTSQP